MEEGESCCFGGDDGDGDGGDGEGAESVEADEDSDSRGAWRLEMSSPSSARSAMTLPTGMFFVPSGAW